MRCDAGPVTPPDSPRAGPFRLLDGSGRPYRSRTPGTLGGYRRGRLYGRLRAELAPLLSGVAPGEQARLQELLEQLIGGREP